MNKNEVLGILEDWNFWRRDFTTGIDRIYYLKKLKRFLSTNQIIVITGARRSGKSFIMRQLAKSLLKENVNKNNILIINFEDPRFEGLNTKTLQRIYDVYLEFLQPKGKIYILLDEIQAVSEWEKWVRMMHELGKAKIIISGSNANLLSGELSSLLTGRHIDLTVFPLSLEEYLLFNNLKIKDRLDFLHHNLEIKGLLRKYIEFGAFPEVVLSQEKKEILLNYYDDILNKDIIRRFKIRKAEKLRELARFYSSNISNLTTFSSIEKFLKISADTIEKFAKYFETAYMFFFVKRLSYKVKNQEKSPRKIYAIDTGLVNVVGFRFSENLGRLAENVVFLQLKREQMINRNMEIFYWKDINHREVDFVIMEREVKKLIQVCWNIETLETKNREVKALLKAMRALNLKEGIIITEDFELEEEINNKKIFYLPLWRWMKMEGMGLIP